MNSKLFLLAALVIMFTSCSNRESEKADEGQTASLAQISGIPYSETTTNPKEGKSVLVVSTSPRRGGNTDLLADAFVKGAKEAGGKVEKIFLADLDLEFLSEQGANQPKDVPHTGDTWMCVQKFLDADVVCLASPTYYMNVSDRMKTFIDATYLAFGDDKMKGKEFYYITACADPDQETAEWCLNGFRGFVMCLPSPTERGSVCATGMGRAGAVKGTQFEKEAYELGKTINKK